ncbi:MAG TPA: TetR/AcrR family transcriptional regulator [Solirubrobacterales bacterium]
MAEERDRIAAAIVALVGSRGYRQTRLEDVLEAAAVGEEEFARHFASKQECFVAVWDELTAAHGVLAARAFASAGPWRERMRAAAWVTLDYLQQDADRTRFLVLEVLNAGEIAQAHRDLAIATQVEWIDAGRREPAAAGSLSRATAEHLAGAINEMLIRKTRSGEIMHGAGVLRELMYMAVRPYLGEEAAREELAMPPPQGIPR